MKNKIFIILGLFYISGCQSTTNKEYNSPPAAKTPFELLVNEKRQIRRKLKSVMNDLKYSPDSRSEKFKYDYITEFTRFLERSWAVTADKVDGRYQFSSLEIPSINSRGRASKVISSNNSPINGEIPIRVKVLDNSINGINFTDTYSRNNEGIPEIYKALIDLNPFYDDLFKLISENKEIFYLVGRLKDEVNESDREIYKVANRLGVKTSYHSYKKHFVNKIKLSRNDSIQVNKLSDLLPIIRRQLTCPVGVN
jgi:hypothetical protein